MKNLVFKFTFCTLGFLLISNHLLSQGPKPMPYFGMVKCAEFYVDETEVTVDSWISYYYWKLLNEGVDQAIAVLPDSNAVSKNCWVYIQQVKPSNPNAVITRIASYTGQLMPKVLKECPELSTQDPYYQGKKLRRCPYGSYPITGLTYEQVMDFCKWKTKIVGHDSIEYRLPSPEEWINIALTGLTDKEKANRTKDSVCKENCITFNYRITREHKDYEYWGTDGQCIKDIGIFAPDKSGIFELFGNVSEMTLTNGISKGGNYSLYASQCRIDSNQIYNKPEKWLGFRCIVKIK